ncbi:SRPBCC family protein [Streptomyces sp. NPDC021749]|uniref:SRPBCC family protein n=1 Tax=Streptomyces sp. NPDC021749 TaxID=3154905 RepID=UPI0034060621
MALRHQLIKAGPEAVWAVLADGSRYQDWVVGTVHSHPKDDRWPRLGAALEYTFRVGPWELDGQTIVRCSEPPRRLELEIDSGRLGTARIALELRPWGEHTVVIADEHPLTGPSGRLHNAGVDMLLQLRHRRMLGNLARVAEGADQG